MSKINTLDPDTSQEPEPTIPQEYNNNYFFYSISQSFEKFWDLYPLKKEKEIAFEVFKKLKPSEVVVDEIIAHLREQIQSQLLKRSEGVWVPAWKYPANWLAQRCWEKNIQSKENDHAIHETTLANQETVHLVGIKHQPSEGASFNDTEFQKLWKLH